ncbi:MAG: hypothetical protein ACE5I1_06415 [bacterium]
MQKREKVLSAITLAAGAFFIVNQFICAGEKAAVSFDSTAEPAVVQNKIQADNVVAGEKVSNDELKNRLQNWQPLVTYENWGRNPFEGAQKLEQADSNADSSSFKLSGIVEKGFEKIALIDDYIVQKGDHTDEFEVMQVFADHVVVRYDGRLITLFLDQKKANLDSGK